MAHSEDPITTYHKGVKVTVDGVYHLICQDCGEIIFDSRMARAYAGAVLDEYKSQTSQGESLADRIGSLLDSSQDLKERIGSDNGTCDLYIPTEIVAKVWTEREKGASAKAVEEYYRERRSRPKPKKAVEWIEDQKAVILRHDPQSEFLTVPPARMADGFEISIQANRFAYCWPRVDICDSYSSFELGFASGTDDLIEEYREGDIFAWVPADVVEKLVEKHGGIVGPARREEMP